VAVVAIGCGSKESSSTSGGSGGGSGSGSATTVAADAKPIAVDAAAVASPLGDLPALSLADVDKAAIEASFKLNNEGYQLHKQKKFDDAAAKYRDAVKSDPANLLARYNLASAWLSAGKTDQALAVLAQFEHEDCRACTGILVHAKSDAEWKSVWTDPRFKAATDAAVADKVDRKKVMKLVIEAFKSGKTDGLEPYIHPRSPIKMTEFIYAPPDQQPKPELVYGWSAFKAYVAKPMKLEDAGVARCDARCCYAGQRGDSSDVVEHVCFGGPGGVSFVTEIGIEYGPA